MAELGKSKPFRPDDDPDEVMSYNVANHLCDATFCRLCWARERIASLEDQVRAHQVRQDLWRRYSELLGKEVAELAPLMHTRGWKSKRVDEGKLLRRELGLE